MGRFARIVLGGGVTFAIVVVAAAGGGRFLFERRISSEVERLFASSQGGRPTLVTEADLAELPEPVQRWLRNAHVVGSAYPVTVRLKQEGEFRLEEGKGWMPFEAVQYYTTDPPGFVWVASFEIAPLLSINGRDRYFDGKSDIDMRLLSVIPVAQKSGGGLNQGAMLRYLSEIIWFPSAAVSPFITWESLDAISARATLSFQGLSASATFNFDDQGQVTSVTAQRYNDDKGRLENWTTPIRAYGELQGIRVPVDGEAIWNYSTGDFSYIRVRITEVKYNQPSKY